MNFNTDNPSIVLVSCCNIKPKSLIKLIANVPQIEDESNPNISFLQWEINTKYYTAKVNMCAITEHYERTDEFNDSVQALIILMDCNMESGLEVLDKWNEIENDCNIEVKLLVFNYFSDEANISKAEAMKWCLIRGFELIELYSISENESNDIIEEKIGIARIVEALQTHVWPNLEMKDAHGINENERAAKSAEHSVINHSQIDLGYNFMQECGDEFSELISKLNAMRDSFKTLPNSQRIQNAEQVLKEFWNALGGDEAELEDI